jgi:putative ABC transport system permease protein
MGMIVAEAAVVAMVGSGLGVAFGYVVSAAVNAYYQGVYQTPLRFAIVTTDIVVLAGVLSLVLGVAAGAVAAQRLVRTAPLALLGR